MQNNPYGTVLMLRAKMDTNSDSLEKNWRSFAPWPLMSEKKHISRQFTWFGFYQYPRSCPYSFHTSSSQWSSSYPSPYVHTTNRISYPRNWQPWFSNVRHQKSKLRSCADRHLTTNWKVDRVFDRNNRKIDSLWSEWKAILYTCIMESVPVKSKRTTLINPWFNKYLYKRLRKKKHV